MQPFYKNQDLMESRNTANNQYITKDKRINRSFYQKDLPVETVENSPVFEKLAEEGCEDFFYYIEWIGLAKDPNLIILSSLHHYYYDTEEMKEVETMVKLKQLNHIKQIKIFLHTIYHILAQECYFIGCFFDNNNQNEYLSGSHKPQRQSAGRLDPVENGAASNIPLINMMYNIMDSRTNRNMTKKTVTLLLREAGFKVLDMTELNGLTYFCTQKRKPFEE